MTNRDIIMQYFNIVDERKFDDLSLVFHHDIVYERPGYPPLVGLERTIAFYKHERILASGIHTVEGIISEGNTCVCWGKFIGTTHSKEAVDERFADLMIFSNDKIKKRTTYFFRPAV